MIRTFTCLLFIFAFSLSCAGPTTRYGGDPVDVTFGYALSKETEGTLQETPLRRWVMTGQAWFECGGGKVVDKLKAMPMGDFGRAALIQELIQSVEFKAMELVEPGEVTKQVPQGQVVYLIIAGNLVKEKTFSSLDVKSRRVVLTLP